MDSNIETIGMVRECGDLDVAAGRADTQTGWYQFASRFVHGKTVIDIGCGLGGGMSILRSTSDFVSGFDIDSRLAGPDIMTGDLADIPSKSVDVAVSIEVIEHVESPVEFLANLRRIARHGIFLTTPNWTASRCQWPYHLREYTPREFFNLLQPLGDVILFKGSSSGNKAYRVRNQEVYFVFNDLRSQNLTAFPTRCWNNLIPNSWRIHSQNAAWVEIPPDLETD